MGRGKNEMRCPEKVSPRTAGMGCPKEMACLPTFPPFTAIQHQAGVLYDITTVILIPLILYIFPGQGK